jgi:hypothetical protein
MSNEEINKFEHSYNYWIKDNLDDGTFSVLIYNFIQKSKPLITDIEELKRRVCYWNELHNEVIEDNVKLKFQINELETADQWISVKDAFPNDNLEVKVKVNCEHNGNGIIEPKYTAKYNHATKYWEAGLSTLYFVTHWRLLKTKDAI